MEATMASGRPLSALLVFLAVVSTAVASLGAPLLPTVAAVDHVRHRCASSRIRD